MVHHVAEGGGDGGVVLRTDDQVGVGVGHHLPSVLQPLRSLRWVAVKVQRLLQHLKLHVTWVCGQKRAHLTYLYVT